MNFRVIRQKTPSGAHSPYQVSPQDVYLQYARAAAQCIHPRPEIPS